MNNDEKYNNLILWGVHQNLLHAVSSLGGIMGKHHPCWAKDYSVDALIDAKSVKPEDIELISNAQDFIFDLREKLELLYDRVVISKPPVPLKGSYAKKA